MEQQQSINEPDVAYEGWANYDTWNVSLWINNEEPLYRAAVEFMNQNVNRKNPYIGFIMSQYMMHLITPDSIEYLSDKLDYPALDNMMRELVA